MNFSIWAPSSSSGFSGIANRPPKEAPTKKDAGIRIDPKNWPTAELWSLRAAAVEDAALMFSSCITNVTGMRMSCCYLQSAMCFAVLENKAKDRHQTQT